MNDQPKTAKGSAVQMWNEAIERLPAESDRRDHLELLDIHDERDRMTIEEIIEHEMTGTDYHVFHDAWHQVKQEFDY